MFLTSGGWSGGAFLMSGDFGVFQLHAIGNFLSIYVWQNWLPYPLRVCITGEAIQSTAACRHHIITDRV